jgi:CheY-like chemotaxis protein
VILVPRPTRGPILIIEDNLETRDLLSRILAIKGYSTVGVGDGPEAVRYLRQRDPVALVILDLHLPSIDGRELLAELKHDPGIRLPPVVVFTAVAASVPDAVEVLRKGSDDPDALLAVVERTCLRA